MTTFIFVWLMLGISAYLITLLESKVVTGKVFGDAMSSELIYMGIAMVLGGLTMVAIVCHMWSNYNE